MTQARETVVVTLSPSAPEYAGKLAQINALRTEMFKVGYNHLLGPIQNTDGTISWVCAPSSIADNTHSAFIGQFVDIIEDVTGVSLIRLCFGGFDSTIRVIAATDRAISSQISSIL
jgi:hypothetical protein